MRMTLGKAGWLLFAMGSFGLDVEARAQSTAYMTLPPAVPTPSPVSPYVTPAQGVASPVPSPYGRPAPTVSPTPPAIPQNSNGDMSSRPTLRRAALPAGPQQNSPAAFPQAAPSVPVPVAPPAPA